MDNQNGAGSGSGEFEAAAARVTAEAGEERPAGESPADSVPVTIMFQLPPELAIMAARGLFWLPARFVHPAWALNPEQESAVGPAVGVMLEELADKWLPQWTADFVSQYPRTAVAGVALAKVILAKWKDVSDARKLEAATKKTVSVGAGLVADVLEELPKEKPVRVI